MQTITEVKVTVSLDLGSVEDTGAEYREHFTVEMNDELDRGEVLAAAISFIGSFQVNMHKIGPVINEANRRIG